MEIRKTTSGYELVESGRYVVLMLGESLTDDTVALQALFVVDDVGFLPQWFAGAKTGPMSEFYNLHLFWTDADVMPLLVQLFAKPIGEALPKELWYKLAEERSFHEIS